MVSNKSENATKLRVVTTTKWLAQPSADTIWLYTNFPMGNKSGFSDHNLDEYNLVRLAFFQSVYPIPCSQPQRTVSITGFQWYNLSTILDRLEISWNLYEITDVHIHHGLQLEQSKAHLIFSSLFCLWESKASHKIRCSHSNYKWLQSVYIYIHNHLVSTNMHEWLQFSVRRISVGIELQNATTQPQGAPQNGSKPLGLPTLSQSFPPI